MKSRDAEKFLPVVKLGIPRSTNCDPFGIIWNSKKLLPRVVFFLECRDRVQSSRVFPIPFSLSLSLSQRLTLFLPFDTFNRITSVIIIIIIVVLLPRRISLSRKNVTGSVNRYSPVNKGRWRRRLRRRLRRRRWRDISVLNWENWEKSECTPSECLQSKGNV